MKRMVGVLPVLSVLMIGCVPLHHSYYEPAGEGKVRNGTLCMLGVRDQLVVQLGHDVEARFSAGDPSADALHVGILFYIPEGRRLELTSSEFVVRTGAHDAAHQVVPDAILTTCLLRDHACKPRLDPLATLQGETLEGSGLLPSTEGRLFTMTLVVPVRPDEGFSLTLPPVRVNGDFVAIRPIQFRRVREIVVEQPLCQ